MTWRERSYLEIKGMKASRHRKKQIILPNRCDEGERVNLSLQSCSLLVKSPNICYPFWLDSSKNGEPLNICEQREPQLDQNGHLQRRGLGLGLTWTGAAGNHSGQNPSQHQQWLALPLCEHPGQRHAWWEYQRHSLYLPGLQGVKLWVHSMERMKAKGYIWRRKYTVASIIACHEKNPGKFRTSP